MMVNTITDYRVIVMNGDRVVRDHGVHDGLRDGRDVIELFYRDTLSPGETLRVTMVERKQIVLADLTDEQRNNIKRNRVLGPSQ
jgi:hypothetical protein